MAERSPSPARFDVVPRLAFASSFSADDARALAELSAALDAGARPTTSSGSTSGLQWLDTAFNSPSTSRPKSVYTSRVGTAASVALRGDMRSRAADAGRIVDAALQDNRKGTPALEDTLIPQAYWRFAYRPVAPTDPVQASHAVYDSQRGWRVRMWPPTPGAAAEREDILSLLQWYSTSRALLQRDLDRMLLEASTTQHAPAARGRLQYLDDVVFREFARMLRSRPLSIDFGDMLQELWTDYTALSRSLLAESDNLRRYWERQSMRVTTLVDAEESTVRERQATISEVTTVIKALRTLTGMAGHLGGAGRDVEPASPLKTSFSNGSFSGLTSPQASVESFGTESFKGEGAGRSPTGSSAPGVSEYRSVKGRPPTPRYPPTQPLFSVKIREESSVSSVAGAGASEPLKTDRSMNRVVMTGGLSQKSYSTHHINQLLRGEAPTEANENRRRTSDVASIASSSSSSSGSGSSYGSGSEYSVGDSGDEEDAATYASDTTGAESEQGTARRRNSARSAPTARSARGSGTDQLSVPPSKRGGRRKPPPPPRPLASAAVGGSGVPAPPSSPMRSISAPTTSTPASNSRSGGNEVDGEADGVEGGGGGSGGRRASTKGRRSSVDASTSATTPPAPATAAMAVAAVTVPALPLPSPLQLQVITTEDDHDVVMVMVPSFPEPLGTGRLHTHRKTGSDYDEDDEDVFDSEPEASESDGADDAGQVEAARIVFGRIPFATAPKEKPQPSKSARKAKREARRRAREAEGGEESVRSELAIDVADGSTASGFPTGREDAPTGAGTGSSSIDAAATYRIVFGGVANAIMSFAPAASKMLQQQKDVRGGLARRGSQGAMTGVRAPVDGATSDEDRDVAVAPDVAAMTDSGLSRELHRLHQQLQRYESVINKLQGNAPSARIPGGGLDPITGLVSSGATAEVDTQTDWPEELPDM